MLQKEQNERIINLFGVIRFFLLVFLLFSIWVFVAFVFISFRFTNYEVCMVLFLPLIVTVILPIALIGIAIAHPFSLKINNKSMNILYIYGMKEEIKFSDVNEIKINYNHKLNHYPIYIKLKKKDKPYVINGIGKNFQNAIIKYSEINNISTEYTKSYSLLPKNSRAGMRIYNYEKIIPISVLLLISLIVIVVSIATIIFLIIFDYFNNFIVLSLVFIILFTPPLMYKYIKKQMKDSCSGISINKKEIIFSKPFIGDLIIQKEKIKDVIKKPHNNILVITINDDTYEINNISKKLVNKLISNLQT